MNWCNRENDGVYLFFLTLRRLEIFFKNNLSIMRNGLRLYVSQIFFIFFLGVLSLEMDIIVFYLVQSNT